MSTGTGVIIASEADPWSDGLKQGLAGLGYDVATGTGFGSALAASGGNPRDVAFVMTGPSVDEAGYLAIARELKLDAATAALPLVRAAGGDCAGGVTIVPDATFDSVESGLALVREEAERWRQGRDSRGGRVTLRSPSDGESVSQLKAMLEQFYEDAFTDETEGYKTLSAFREAIDNAAVHGNRNMPDKCLTVALIQDDTRVALDVKDEGPGFEHAELVEKARRAGPADHARERITKGEAGGIGIKVMAECVDEIRYSEGGSRVTLVKRRGEAATSPGA